MSQFSHLLNRIELLVVYILPLNKSDRKEEKVVDGFELFCVILSSTLLL